MTAHIPAAPPRMREAPSALGRALEATARKADEVHPAARARVWRNLHAPAKRSRGFLRWAAGGVALAAIALAVWFAIPKQGRWQLDGLSGSVALSGVPAQGAQSLPADAVISVGPESAATLSRGSVKIALAPGSRLRLDRATGPVLEQGTAAVHVLDAHRFSMMAGAYSFDGANGVFFAEVSSVRTRVRSDGAKLELREGGKAQELAPGSSWSSLSREDSIEDSINDPFDPVALQPLSDLVRSSAPKPDLRSVAIYRAPDPSARDGAALLAKAHEAEGAKEYARAASLYAQLAALDGIRAPAALYELARLRLRFLNQPAAALQALDEERARFPEGPLAQEVALSAVEARLALQQDDATLREMDGFLGKYASSERTGEVRWLRASLYLREGKCERAKPELAALSTDAAFASEALFGDAYCARLAGQLARSRDELRDYLRRFPSGARAAEARSALDGEALRAP